MKKKGQMKISFGMIFSIILIIVFLVFAFSSIKGILNFQKDATFKQFQDNFQKDLDKMHMGSSGSQQVSYGLPKDVEQICFVDDEFGNMVVRRDRDENINFEHLDIVNTLNGKKTLCFNNEEGKVKFLLEKKYGEPLVKVSEI